MRVFVLNTGRCGSLTFAKACSYITNYSTGHESLAPYYGEQRLEYPDGHIEVDNRLSWFLGALDTRFGNQAFYIHLRRNPEHVAKSFFMRWRPFRLRRVFGTTKAAFRDPYTVPINVIQAFSNSLIMPNSLTRTKRERLELCRFYVDTVNSNIRMFLKDKTQVATIDIESPSVPFTYFWDAIGAEGDFKAALKALSTSYNANRR